MIIDCKSIAQDIKDKIKNIIVGSYFTYLSSRGQPCIQRLY